MRRAARAVDGESADITGATISQPCSGGRQSSCRLLCMLYQPLTRRSCTESFDHEVRGLMPLAFISRRTPMTISRPRPRR